MATGHGLMKGKRGLIIGVANNRSIAWGIAALVSPHVSFIVVVPASVVVLYYRHKMQVVSTSAVTNAFEAQAHYKDALHQAVWRGGRTLALMLVVKRLFLS